MSRLNFLISLIFYTILILLSLPFISVSLITLLAYSLGYIFIIGFFYPQIGLFLFLFTRPLLDYFTEQKLFEFKTYNINLASLWGIAVLLLVAHIIYKNYHRFRELPLFRPWLIFVLIIIITIPLSVHTALSLRELIRILTIISFFVLGFLMIQKDHHLINLAKIAIYSMLIPGILAYYQFFTNTGLTLPLEDIYNRIYGTFAHPNLFAFYLIIPLILTCVIVLIKKKEDITTYSFLLFLGFLFVLLILTYTRGAWLAFFLALFIIGILKYRKVFLMAIVAFLLIYITIPTFQERTDKIVNPDPYGSIIWRFELWRGRISYIQDRPWLGHGSGTATDVILKNRGEKKGSPNPHNDYLKIALEYGLMGLAVYLYLLAAVLWRLWKQYRQEDRNDLKTLYLGIFALTLSLFIMSFGDNMIRNTALQWTLWSLIGGTLALSCKKHNKKAPSV